MLAIGCALKDLTWLRQKQRPGQVVRYKHPRYYVNTNRSCYDIVMNTSSLYAWLSRSPHAPLQPRCPALCHGPATAVAIRDWRSSLAFYRSHLLFEVVQSVPGCMAWLRHAGADVLLLPTDATPGRWDGPRRVAVPPRHYRIPSLGVRPWQRQLAASWAHTSIPVPGLAIHPWAAVSMTTTDPDGNTLHFEQRLNPGDAPCACE
jgi:catechol 2,3-dioxygenase-like lactoylglutathione lyase family enzyme